MDSFLDGLLFVTGVTFLKSRIFFLLLRITFCNAKGLLLLKVWVTFCNYKWLFLQKIGVTFTETMGYFFKY